MSAHLRPNDIFQPESQDKRFVRQAEIQIQIQKVKVQLHLGTLIAWIFSTHVNSDSFHLAKNNELFIMS